MFFNLSRYISLKYSPPPYNIPITREEIQTFSPSVFLKTDGIPSVGALLDGGVFVIPRRPTSSQSVAPSTGVSQR